MGEKVLVDSWFVFFTSKGFNKLVGENWLLCNKTSRMNSVYVQIAVHEGLNSEVQNKRDSHVFCAACCQDSLNWSFPFIDAAQICLLWSRMLYANSSDQVEWWMNMNENVYTAHRNTHTKDCMYTAVGAHGAQPFTRYLLASSPVTQIKAYIYEMVLEIHYNITLQKLQERLQNITAHRNLSLHSAHCSSGWLLSVLLWRLQKFGPSVALMLPVTGGVWGLCSLNCWWGR